jgi:hypothetical protein
MHEQTAVVRLPLGGPIFALEQIQVDFTHSLHA